MLHIHSATEEVVLKQLICHIDKKTGKPDKEKGRPRFVKQVRDLDCVLHALAGLCKLSIFWHANLTSHELSHELNEPSPHLE